MSLAQALFTGSASKKVVFGITIDILNKCFGEKRKDGVLWSRRRRIGMSVVAELEASFDQFATIV